MKKKHGLIFIVMLLCTTLFWFLYNNNRRGGKVVSVSRTITKEKEAAVLHGDETVSATRGDNPERFVYDGESFGSREAMEEAKKQDQIDLYGASAELTFHVTDSEGRDVSGATLTACFRIFEKTVEKTAKTDKNGIFVAEGKTDGEIVYFVKKEGYYNTQATFSFNRHTDTADVKNGKWIPWNPTIEVTLKEIRNPIPMYVKRAGIRLPKKGEPFGMDFKIGDLVAPHGKGKNADIFLKCWGDKPIPLTRAVSRHLTLSSDKIGEGFIRISKDGGLFTSIYEAPTDGYQPEVYLNYARTNDKILDDKDFPQNEYIVFRSRVELDDDGKIAKSNYGKIFDIWFDISADDRDGAAIRFIYYFNPTPNDRNLEFDTSYNLFGNDWRNRIEIP